MSKPKKIGILLSGRGSNFLAIHSAIAKGELQAEICCVISNVKDALGLEIARKEGLRTFYLDHTLFTREDFDRQLVDILRDARADLVCLAGFMRILSPVIIEAFAGRILNIHPSLLPSFPGLHAQRQALQSGVNFSGCTVHLVECGLDSGPIILQAVVPLLDHDTEESLSARILKEEHLLYPRAIRIVLSGSYQWVGRRYLPKV